MFETGLAVGRSLGRNGIKVYGFDTKRDIGFYSHYINAKICPDPNTNENEFINFLLEQAASFKLKPVLFITSDNFLLPAAKNLKKLEKRLIINLPRFNLLSRISNKFEQYKLAKQAGINVPETLLIENERDIEEVINSLAFPVFIKGMESNEWRKIFGGSKKGFVYKNPGDLKKDAEKLLSKKITLIAQELIEGPDTNHYKFCGYVSKEKELTAGFCLRKLRQNPVHYGVGSLVESIEYPELMETGAKFFNAINYAGVGSEEFKLDERDVKLKLIELNPRYWQQNSVAEVCGINFPLIQYRDLTGQPVEKIFEYKPGIKWVNIYSDFDSYLSYRKEKSLNFMEWLKSLKGKKVFSDWAKDDIIPGFYEIRFGKRLFNIPKYIYNKIFG